ncbi:uncharacterized protein LOC111709204 [Eurytemora carolleeae]|uniref:uncharacterized protein LOC111709204 n=1 Tax=Eurytemora carolleeae TaxID=1294199 RepID=UPI000C76F8D7|nr:uncharacterized protein LOC111709204 [Eurytemora carolleeae]|eukprot:XP_023338588.1 uncharacterized protein LOC111709204 [Eurytemora affinis]
MVTFQRMREDFDDLSNQVSAKVPGRPVFWLIISVSLVLILLIGFGIGFGSRAGGYCSGAAGCSEGSLPVYYFLSNKSESCPALYGERLLTTLAEGNSFEGLSVNLQCSGDYVPFPLQVKCMRRQIMNGESVLEWSGLPVCYPAMLVTPLHWSKIKHARSVSCVGNSQETVCSLQCVQDYIAVEQSKHMCQDIPCRAWTPEGRQCYFCDQNCTELAEAKDPKPSDLLRKLSCDEDCEQIVVSSDGMAAVWQNKRTGIFRFIGEHNGRPVYQNNATKEYLYYTFTGAEWLVGPDFRKPHAGIQVFQNDDKTCPERHGGDNITKLYIDSSKPVPLGDSMWQNDTTISFQCYKPNFLKTTNCKCTEYKVYNTVYETGMEVPTQVDYFSGIYSKEENTDNTFGLLAPLYINKEKNLYLFSHHIAGKVWQMSDKMTTTPLRGIFSRTPACPDSEDISWEWYNLTTPTGQQLYVEDYHIKVKCISHGHGA